MNDKPNWPTLEGRLSQPITSELEALKQLKTMVPLSKHGEDKLKKLTSHQGYPIGERGQAIGHCCGNGCIDCAFWCRDESQRIK
jgi:hypothetical protein